MLAAVNITIENKSTTNSDIEAGTLAPGAWTVPPPPTVAPNQTAEAVVYIEYASYTCNLYQLYCL